MLLGLSGPAQVGKDSIAQILVDHHGFRRVAFADKIRDALFALNPWITPRYVINPKKDREGEHRIKDAFEAFPAGTWRLQEVVGKVGWDLAKQLPEVRGLLQRMGTEVGRAVDEYMWIRAAFPDDHLTMMEDIVVTDVRFENEATFIRMMHGAVVHVSRPGFGPVNEHVSDRGLRVEVGDWEIANDEGLGELRVKVEAIIRAIIDSRSRTPHTL